MRNINFKSFILYEITEGLAICLLTIFQVFFIHLLKRLVKHFFCLFKSKICNDWFIRSCISVELAIGKGLLGYLGFRRLLGHDVNLGLLMTDLPTLFIGWPPWSLLYAVLCSHLHLSLLLCNNTFIQSPNPPITFVMFGRPPHSLRKMTSVLDGVEMITWLR